MDEQVDNIFEDKPTKKKRSAVNPDKLAKDKQRKHLEWEKAIIDAVSADDMTAIMSRALHLARQGDPKARDFIFDRLFGKATNRISADVKSNNISPEEAQQKLDRLLGL